MDFLTISFESVKKGVQVVVPKFKVKRSKDLMIRGKDFYAIWDEENNTWATDQDTAVRLIDNEIRKVYEKALVSDDRLIPKYLEDSSSGMIDKWHHYCQKQMEDNYHQLNQKIIFSNTEVKREDYSSIRLPYALEEGDISAWDELVSVLYSDEERMKIEWAIGAVVSGDSKKIQKFVVLTGDAGTGKSTIIKIICKLFEGYTASIDAKAIGSAQSQFALEPLKDSPLVAYEDDTKLTRLEDNTRLNSLVSHERMSVNAKFKSPYEMSFSCFLFLGSNGDVQITDARSGIQRRLIDIRPTGMKFPYDKYLELIDKIDFELGAIAYHCLQVYKKNKRIYDNYIPMKSLRSTNPFYNFMEENYFEYKDLSKSDEGLSLDRIWHDYKEYCDKGGILYRLNRFQIKTEAMAYFDSFVPDLRTEEGKHARSRYYEIKPEKFGFASDIVASVKKKLDWLLFVEQRSGFDIICADCPAQYANDQEKPVTYWSDVVTKLKEILTSRLHYVKVPENHIVIDFDLKDENGNKSFKLNKKAASKWPETYAELSKSGEGIHLHYIYDGDPTRLSRVYDEDIEVKVFTGNSSLRRKLTKCNNLPIAHINSGLPLKGEKKVVSFDVVKNEKAIRKIIRDCLEKKHHGATKPEVDFIFKILEDAYKGGIIYDVSDMRPAILAFANKSTNQALTCIKLVNKMHFRSEEDRVTDEDGRNAPLVFYDCEVLPNLFVVCWKKKGCDKVVKMINPSPDEIENLTQFKLVDFNGRRYDRHILYARMMGYTEDQLFNLSQKIINGSSNCFFGEAYNIGYTDVYDFCSEKKSLKKWEIELGIHHQELGLPWNLPVPEDMWLTVADYCANDVIATEAVFNNRYEDFVARKILADLAGLTVNHTTNQLTTQIIFGNVKKPQVDFVYTDLSEMFPGYKFERGKSSYRGEDPGEGGYVYSEPGMYGNVALLDVASMHPTSIEQLNLFGPYTKNFSAIKEARIAIKHKEYDRAGKMFDGKLKKYLESDDQADALSYALKIAINSVYGLTSAKFDNKCRDPRNIDNIVAKRGALFMIDLKHEVQEKGFRVAHIKTDSIKIPDATPEIISFVMEFGRKYGYTFEHEATYDKMCLVNKAVYIARYKDSAECKKLYDGFIPEKNRKYPNKWTATGDQFAQPYVFKTLFSKEQIVFKDMCETRTVSTALYLDLNEGLPEGEHNYHFVGKAGLFCPIKPGCGGGILLREKDGKYDSASKAKDFRWLESEVVKNLGKEEDIDRSYYTILVDAAVHDISEYGDFEWFVAEESYNGELKVPIEADKEYQNQLKELEGAEDIELPFN